MNFQNVPNSLESGGGDGMTASMAEINEESNERLGDPLEATKAATSKVRLLSLYQSRAGLVT